MTQVDYASAEFHETVAMFYGKMVEFTGAEAGDEKGRFAEWLAEFFHEEKERAVREHISATEDHPWQEDEEAGFGRQAALNCLDELDEDFFFKDDDLWTRFDIGRYYNLSRPSVAYVDGYHRYLDVGAEVLINNLTPAGFYLLEGGILVQRTAAGSWTRLSDAEAPLNIQGFNVGYQVIRGPVK